MVARDGGVLATEVAGQLPHDAGAGDEVERLALGLRVLVALPTRRYFEVDSQTVSSPPDVSPW